MVKVLYQHMQIKSKKKNTTKCEKIRVYFKGNLIKERDPEESSFDTYFKQMVSGDRAICLSVCLLKMCMYVY